MPRLEWYKGTQVVSIRAKVNVNLKSEQIEDIIGRRRKLHLAGLDNLKGELFRDLNQMMPGRLEALPQSVEKADDLRNRISGQMMVERIREQFLDILERHKMYPAEQFNDVNVYKALTVEAIDSKEFALRKMNLFISAESQVRVFNDVEHADVLGLMKGERVEFIEIGKLLQLK